MTTIRTATKRVLALLALALVAIVVIVMVTSAVSDDDGTGKREAGKERVQGKKNRNGGKPEEQQARKSYVVQSGDTLSSIAEETGVTVERLQELNPDIDPQILVSGQKLKLR